MSSAGCSRSAARITLSASSEALGGLSGTGAWLRPSLRGRDPPCSQGRLDCGSALRGREDMVGRQPLAAASGGGPFVATAVVQLLDDPRSVDGEWHDEVQRWLDGRIRKVARRARGSKWDAAAELPGVTVSHAGAQVRAF